MTITKEVCIEQAEHWLDAAISDRNGFSQNIANATATIALTYATLAAVVPAEGERFAPS